jgi:hypothetical protein
MSGFADGFRTWVEKKSAIPAAVPQWKEKVMTRCDRSRTRWFLAAATLLVGGGACTDTALLPAPSSAVRSDVASPGNGGGGGGGGGQRRLTIVAVNLSTSSLVIGGANVGYTVTVENKGSTVSGVTLQGAIVQGAVNHPAGEFAANCPPNTTGVVPKGSCQMTSTTGASNANGVGTLVPGPANFVLTMSLSAGGTSTVLDQTSVPVTLSTGTLGITNLELNTTTLAIGGANVPYDITIFNPGSSLSEVWFQGEIIQNGNVAGAGGSNVLCPPTLADAVLPTGSCTMSFSVRASNQSSSPAPLVAGAATFKITLNQGFSSPVVLDTRSVAVTLVGGPPEITNVVFDATVPRRVDDGTVILLIDQNTSNGYTVTINNSGLQLTGMGIQAELHQGTTVRGAGGSGLLCQNLDPVPPAGTLPTGTCSMLFNTTATNTAGGIGDLTEGYADWVLDLQDSNGTTIDSRTIRVYLAMQQR